MNEYLRPKPLCLMIISGLHVDYLFDSKAYNLQGLADNYPFLVLSSSEKNVDRFYDSYIELGSGSSIEEKSAISLSQVISDAELTQLHLADIESSAYATYFFNNKNKTKHNKEVWFKKSLAKFDFCLDNNDMVHNKLTKKLLQEVDRQYYDFIVVNYNNLLISSDKIKALNDLDKKIKDIVSTILSFNGAILITSNSSLIKSNNKVPLFLVGKEWKGQSFIGHDYQKKINEQAINGDITQIAPTILQILGLLKPRKMKTKSLI